MFMTAAYREAAFRRRFSANKDLNKPARGHLCPSGRQQRSPSIRPTAGDIALAYESHRRVAFHFATQSQHGRGRSAGVARVGLSQAPCADRLAPRDLNGLKEI